MKKCVIIGACDCNLSKADLNILKESVVICADGGYKTTLKYNVKPDFTIGDFDSLGYIPDAENVISHSSIKDDTDTALCVQKALELGCDEFYIFGAVGGRIDHSLANFQLICKIAQDKHKIFLISDDFFITAITNGTLKLKPQASGIVSIFCMGQSVCNVSIKGLKYELENSLFPSFTTLGVSNEFVGNGAEISTPNGTVLIMVQRTDDIGNMFYTE